MKYRKNPLVIDAICPWKIEIKDADMKALDDFCGFNWGRADAHDMPHLDEADVVVWNTKEKCWIPVPIGHLLIRGIDGEIYPCDPKIFNKTYTPVDS